MYPYYALFSEERRESEEARGWFRDGMHFPEPMFPFDFVTADSPYMCLGQANYADLLPFLPRSGSIIGCCTAGCT